VSRKDEITYALDFGVRGAAREKNKLLSSDNRRSGSDLAGSANHVGIGTDMDGGLGREQIPQEIQTSADLPRVRVGGLRSPEPCPVTRLG